MRAEIVIVHPDSLTASRLAFAFQARGWTVRHYADPLLAMDALEQANLIKLLVTCVAFHDGRSNGISLALMTRSRRPNVKLIFMCAPGDEQHARELGECVALPTDVPAVVEKGEALLQDHPAHSAVSSD